MNLPTNLLMDLEMAKSRLREAFEPAPETNPSYGLERRTSQGPLSSQCVRQEAAPSSGIVPEVGGCAAFCC
jgi:hypothetical protein